MRVLKWVAFGLVSIVVLLAIAIGAWNVIDRGPVIAEARATSTTFDASRLLVLADGDMAATAYADGQLYPIADATDLLIRLDSPGGNEQRSDVRVPNTVMGWPGAMAVSSDGTYAYVTESRGSVDRSVEDLPSVYDGMPTGRRLTTLDIASGQVIGTTDVCARPNSVDVAPSGGWLLVVCGDASSEIAVVPLTNGVAGEGVDSVRRFDLDLPDVSLLARDEGLTYGVVHPTGEAAGIVASNRGVSLVRFVLDAGGVPNAATAEQPSLAGDVLTVARWTKTGDYLLVADVGWGPAPTDAVLNGAGAIHSFALSPSNDARGVVSSATVGKSPEAFEVNRDGTLLVAVNMERSYLPGGPLALVPGRGASSLSLVSVDPSTGDLSTLNEPVGFRGVLPEDAVFDRDGDQLAVVVYQDHDAPRSDGWIEFFAIEGEGASRNVVPTGRRIPLPRGTHDLAVID